MWKRTVVIAAVAIVAHALGAQARGSVPIVRPVYYQQMIATFESVAERYRSEGRDLDAAFYEALAEGGFGSGTLLRSSSTGDLFAVTNAHVVSGSQSVRLRISLADQDMEDPALEVEGRVIYSDPEMDIAVIRIEADGAFGGEPLALDVGEVTDGDRIWSAGYPALLGRPTWQLASGNVTNRRAIIPELLADDEQYLIQHSAPIDPGSSGGPLLVETGEEGSGQYEVAGVNTWRAFGRENTSYAVPAELVATVLRDALDVEQALSSGEGVGVSFSQTMDEFMAFLSEDDPSVGAGAELISYELTAEMGWRTFDTLVRSLPSEQRNRLSERFVLGSPIEAMRESIAYVARRDAPQMVATVTETPTDSALVTSVESGEPVLTTIRFGDREEVVSWRLEHGNWRLVSYSWKDAEPQLDTSGITARSDREGGDNQLDATGLSFLAGLNYSSIQIEGDDYTTLSPGIGYLLGFVSETQWAPPVVLGWDFTLAFTASEMRYERPTFNVEEQGTLGYTALAIGARSRFQTRLGSEADSPFLYGGVNGRVEIRFPLNVLTLSETELDAFSVLTNGIEVVALVPSVSLGVEFAPSRMGSTWGIRADLYVSMDRISSGGLFSGSSGYHSFALSAYFKALNQ